MKVETTLRPRILLADEDLNFARSFQEFLTNESNRVALTRSASQATALAEGNSDLHLAFVDSEISPKGAIALMGQLHRVRPNLQVIITSTTGTPEAAVEAIRCGAEDYLVKPFNFGVVAQKAARLLQLLELRQTVREYPTCFTLPIHTLTISPTWKPRLILTFDHSASITRNTIGKM